MVFTIQLANLYIEISSLYSQIWYMCRNYIYRSTEKKIPDLCVFSAQEEIDALKHETNILVADYDKNDDECMEVVLIHRKITEALLSRGLLLIHGSVIVTDNEAYMISGPSGIGKTYRTKLWLQQIPNSYILNGDKPYIFIKEDKVFACGSPWCGKERFSTNKIVPLKAIFFLERAEKTNVIRLSFQEIFNNLLLQTYHPSDSYQLIPTIKLLKQMDGKIGFFKFFSSIDPNSVRIAYETAKKYL